MHGNVLALRAAITALEREGVDEWLCAGDLVGYGPHPNEVVETLAELGAVTVAGNHDLMVLGELPVTRSPVVADSTRWTRAELRPDSRAHLAALPRTVTRPGLVMTHGALGDPERYVSTPERVTEQLARLAARNPDRRYLVLGHTHRQWVCDEAGSSWAEPAGTTHRLPPDRRFVLNPGSVGQSRDRERRPSVRCAVLDVDRGEILPLAIGYDHLACRAALRAKGLPLDAVHRRGGPVRRVRRRAVSALRLVGRRVRHTGV